MDSLEKLLNEELDDEDKEEIMMEDQVVSKFGYDCGGYSESETSFELDNKIAAVKNNPKEVSKLKKDDITPSTSNEQLLRTLLDDDKIGATITGKVCNGGIIWEHQTINAQEKCIVEEEDITPATSNEQLLCTLSDREVCKLCGKEFDDVMVLKFHLTNVHKKCSKCPKWFKKRKQLKEHGRTHVKYLYRCCCGQNYIVVKWFLYYLRKEKMELKSDISSCILCDKVFHTEPDLLKHMFNDCGIKVLHRDHLKKHMHKENGKTDFKCTKCLDEILREEFIFENLLKAHNV